MPPTFNQNMEGVVSSETSVSFYQPTQRLILNDNNFHDSYVHLRSSFTPNFVCKVRVVNLSQLSHFYTTTTLLLYI